MEIFTPAFNEIRKLLYDIIIEFIGNHHYVSSNEINKHIEQLKEKDKKEFSLIGFTYSFPYSDQVQEVLVDLIRHCIIDQSNKGYILTSFGKKKYNNIKNHY